MFGKPGECIETTTTVSDDDLDCVFEFGAKVVDYCYEILYIVSEVAHRPSTWCFTIGTEVETERVDGECSRELLVVDLILVCKDTVEDDGDLESTCVALVDGIDRVAPSLEGLILLTQPLHGSWVIVHAEIATVRSRRCCCCCCC